MLDLDPYRIQVDDGVNIIKGAVLPEPDFFGYRIGNLGDQGGRYFDPVHILQVGLDVPGGHPLGVHGDDLVVKAFEAALTLGNDGRIKGGIAVTGNGKVNLAEIAFDLLLVAAVAGVAGIVAARGILGVAEVLGELSSL